MLTVSTKSSEAAPRGAEIIDTIDLPILVVRRDCTVASFNQAAATFFSLAPSDVGRSLCKVPLLSHVKRLEEFCVNAIDRGVSSQGDVRDATGSWFVLRIVPCRASEQQISGAVLTLTNVTVLRASLDQAVREREYTKAIINTVIDPLVVLDEDLRIQTANHAFHAMFHLSREEARSLRLCELGNRDWETALRTCVRDSQSATAQFEPVEVEHEFPVGRRTLLLKARSISRTDPLRPMTLLTIHDITEQKQAEARLEADLADTRLLQSVSAEIVQELNGHIFDRIIDAATAIMRSDFASLQMLYPERGAPGSGGELRLLAFRGFNPQAASFWEWVRADSESTCGQALRTRRRAIAADVQKCEYMAGSEDLATYLQTGIHAVQTTPLLSRSGALLGMISTHWNKPHDPPERDLRLLDILARQAADLIERKQAEEALRENEERYRSLVSVITDVPWTTDAQGQFVTPQDAYSRYTGKSWEELRGSGWTQCIHPDDRADLMRIWKEAVANRSNYFAPCREWHGPTQQWRHVIARGTPVFNPDGSLREWVGSLTDVHEQKLAAQALGQSEQRFRVLADNMAQLAWTCDVLGNVTWYNRRWLDYTGMTFEDMRGWDWKKVQHPDHVERVVARMQRSAETGEVWEDTFPLRGKDGQYRWFLSRAVPIRDEQGNVVRWFGTNTDVTEQRAAQEALHQAHELLGDQAKQMELLVQQRTARLQEALGELEAFSYSVAHDLRAPLRAMSAYAEVLLQETGVSAQGQNYLQRIHRAALRLDRLTQEVLTYSQLARAEIQLQPVDLDNLARQVIEQYPELGPTNDCKDKIEIRSPLLPVLGHEGFLTQVLANLLINACKFVAPGTAPKVILRTEAIGPEGVRIWVEDNGIGIAPQHKDRLFKMFSRIHPDKKYEGTGIGLAVVKKAAERMGGAVGFESELGKGSRFWVQLAKA